MPPDIHLHYDGQIAENSAAWSPKNQKYTEEPETFGRIKRIKAREVIFRQGEEAIQCFSIAQGVVKLVKTFADGNQRIVGLLSAPDFMGQWPNEFHTYSAEAATAAELFCYQRETFNAFLKTQPRMTRAIFETLLRERDSYRDWSALLGRKSSYERVAGFLLMIAARTLKGGSGEADRNCARFRLPLTRGEIADYLGITLETVSRQFTRLKSTHIIDLPSSREVIVPDLRLLAAVANI